MAERPKEEEIAKWHRWFAVEANNRAWTLTELAEPSEGQRAEALRTAYASAYHWSIVGTEENRMLSEMLLARAHVLAREPEQALRYAESTLRYLSGRESEPWQLAFAHAILADAAALAGNVELHGRHYPLARDIGESLGREDRAVFQATFDRVPAPSM